MSLSRSVCFPGININSLNNLYSYIIAKEINQHANAKHIALGLFDKSVEGFRGAMEVPAFQD